ncbi:linear gramicidin synthetase subunit D, partial [Elysia marginata]
VVVVVAVVVVVVVVLLLSFFFLMLLLCIFFRGGFTGVAVYCGTKFFGEGVSESLRQEVAKYNVKVTTIQPGYVALDGPERPVKDAEAHALCSPPADLEVLQPEDIAQAVLYAVTQPRCVAVNQMLVQPVGQPL